MSLEQSLDNTGVNTVTVLGVVGKPGQDFIAVLIASAILNLTFNIKVINLFSSGREGHVWDLFQAKCVNSIADG